MEAVYDALATARHYVPQAIYEATGEELHAMVAGIIPGLLLCVGVLAASTALGAAAGAAIGALAFGTLAAPGAVVGAQAGFEGGTALLGYLGLAFLVAYIGESLWQAAGVAADGIKIAWRSVDDEGPRWWHIERAANRLAFAVGLVFRGVLQGIIAFLLAKGAAAAASRVPELVNNLRSSKLGAGFAEWVEGNWKALIDNPRLKGDFHRSGMGGGSSEGVSAGAVEEAKAATAGASGGGGQSASRTPVRIGGSTIRTVQDNQLHNQTWSKIEVKDFTANRPEGPVDLQNLSPNDRMAMRILKQQGRTNEKAEEILNSGRDFTPRQFKAGEKMYGFDSSPSQTYMGKDTSSPYWLDQAGYDDMQTRFEQNGEWDRQGVKNYLALPCYNRADALVQGVVTKDDAGVQSVIGPATENITYIAPDGTVVSQGLTLPGGGTQVTPSPGTVAPLGGNR